MLYLDRGCHGQSQPPCGVQPLLRQMLQGVQRKDRLLQITQQVGRGHTRAQCPQTPTSPWRGLWSGLLSWDGQGSHGPRSAARTRPGSTVLTGPVSVLLEPRAQAFPWNLVRRHNGGRHAWPALTRRQALVGTALSGCLFCLGLARTRSGGSGIKSILQIRKPRLRERKQVEDCEGLSWA